MRFSHFLDLIVFLLKSYKFSQSTKITFFSELDFFFTYTVCVSLKMKVIYRYMLIGGLTQYNIKLPQNITF